MTLPRKFLSLAALLGILGMGGPIAISAADGDLDTTFDSSVGANSTVESIAVKPDGKVVIGGTFTSYGFTERQRVAQLNANGSLDTGFDPNAAVTPGNVLAVATDSDGKVLVGGEVTDLSGPPQQTLARLNANGSQDTTFNAGNTGFGIGGRIHAIVVQPDGRILVGGYLGSYNGISRNGLYRLNADGSLDSSFVGSGTQAIGAPVFAISLLPDGKIVVGGEFNTFNGTPRARLARLHPDGSLDTTFDPQTGPDQAVFAVPVQPDGKIVIAGQFSNYNGVSISRIARVNVDGLLDNAFTPGTGASNHLKTAVLQADGKILITGIFTNYNGMSRSGFARINPDGSPDPSLISGLVSTQVNALALEAGGKILLGGTFTEYQATPRGHVARVLNPGTSAVSDKGVYFDTATHPKTEGETAQVIVRRGAGSTGPVSVQFTVGGTATPSGSANSDFNVSFPSNLQVDFQPIEYEKTIFISLSFNAGAEPDETVILTLQSPVGDAQLGATTVTTITIGDTESPSEQLPATTSFTVTPPTIAGNPWGFSAVQASTAAGLTVRVQSTLTPGSEASWQDLPGGGLMTRSDDSWNLSANGIPAGKRFFRAIAAAPGFGDSISNVSGEIEVIPEVILRLTGTATSPSDATGKTTRPGEVLTYTLNYQNLSGGSVTGVVVSAGIPDDTGFLPSKVNGGRVVTRKINGKQVKQVEWALGTVAAGAAGSLQMDVRVAKNARIESQIDFVKSSVIGTLNGALLQPSRGTPLRSLVLSLLDVTSTNVTTQVGPGGLVTYTFTVHNSGGAPMNDVLLTYDVVTGSAVVSAFFLDANGIETGSPIAAPNKAWNPTVDLRGETVTWHFGKLAAKSTRKAKLTLRLWYDRPINESLIGGDLVGSFRDSKNKVNKAARVVPATVASSGLVAAARPFLGLSKTVSDVVLISDPTVGEVAATTHGDTYTYTLWYYNIGDATAERVFIQERVPEGAAYVPKSLRVNDAVPSKEVTINDRGRTLVVPIGNVAAGGFGTISYRVKALPRSSGGLLLNTFLESRGGYIGTASLGETIDAYPEPLRVKLVAPVSFSPSSEERPGSAAPGQVVSHFISFRNNGGVPARNARITNPIPAGTVFRGASFVDHATPSDDTIAAPALGVDSGDIIFRLGNMAPGENVTVLVDLEVTPSVLSLSPPEVVNLPQIAHGPEVSRQTRALLAAAEDSNPFGLLPSVFVPGRTRVLHSTVPRFFLGMMAPAAVRAGAEFTYQGFYGNTGDAAGTATIRLYVPPATAEMKIVNLNTDGPDPTVVADYLNGNITITALVPGHTKLTFELVCRAIGDPNEVIVSSGHRISGDGFSFVSSHKALATYIYPADGNIDVTTANSAVESALLETAGVNYAYGRENAVFKEELAQLGIKSISTILVGTDYIALKNGAFAIPLGAGQVLVGAAGIISNDGASIISNDGASIISSDGASIISNDGASIISGGAGNIRFEGLPGFTGSPSAAQLLSDPNRIISGGAGNLMNFGGHNLFGGANGAGLVNNAGGAFLNTDYFRATSANIISGGAGNIISGGAGNIISGGAGNAVVSGAGNIVNGGGGNLIGQDGAGIISNDGASLSTFGGGNIISGGGGNIISGGAGNIISGGAGN